MCITQTSQLPSHQPFSRKHGRPHCSGEGRCLKQDTSGTNHMEKGQELATVNADNRRLKGAERPPCGRRPLQQCSRQRPLTQDTPNSSCTAARKRQCPAGKKTKDYNSFVLFFTRGIQWPLHSRTSNSSINYTEMQIQSQT